MEASQKYYGVENGLIIYETNTTAKSFKSSTTKSLVFKHFGAVELTQELGYMQSGKNKFPIHTMNKRDNEIFYTVNFEQKRIDSFPLKKFMPLVDIKTERHEDIMGYECDILELPTAKLWIYKGIILKQITHTDEIDTVSSAIKIVFNAPLKSEILKLPDFKSEKSVLEKKINTDKEYFINNVDISDIIEGAQVIESIVN